MELPTHVAVTLWRDRINFIWAPPLVAKIKFHWWSYPLDLARAIRASSVNGETYGDREQLERIFSVVVELPIAVGELAEVTSLRFINPPSGFVYDDHCTRAIEGDRDWIIRHSAHFAAGQKVEYGKIEYNHSIQFDYDAEAKMIGDISVGLPDRHHGTYKERVRPLVDRSFHGASFEYRVADIDAVG
jgi:hypothetical protein